jgi:peroxiredoxin Q/BCP
MFNFALYLPNNESFMNIGDKLPEVLGTDFNGREVKTSDFASQPLIVYFYPKDNTSGCTAEACSISESYEELRALGYKIIGISKDTSKSHAKFAEKYNLPFTLLSDETTEVNQAFGVWQLKKFMGREYMGTARTTFISDANHVITHIVTKVDTKKAGEQLLELIKG